MGGIIAVAIIAALMASKPVILIPIPIQDADKRRFLMGRNYVRSVIDAGGVPVMAPVTLDAASLRALYESAAGVLLTGGADLDPVTWGEERIPETRGVDHDREAAETLLTQWAIADDKALLGICRGVQQLNVALGGSLIQDIPLQRPASRLQHQGDKLSPDRDHVAHTICVEPHTRLGGALGLPKGGEVGVNSFHHQALKQVAEGLQVTSRADDGIIESVEMPDRRFIVGVQWHPEEMSAGRADMQALFNTFVSAAQTVAAPETDKAR